MDQRAERQTLQFLAGSGESGAQLREMDWTGTALGDPAAWPATLQTLTTLMLRAPQPMCIIWGPERILLFNDSFIPFVMTNDVKAQGRGYFEVVPGTEAMIGPLFDKVFDGQAIQMDDIAVELIRNGVSAIAHFAFSYTPIFGNDGGVLGLFCACTETTSQVRNARAAAEALARVELEIRRRTDERDQLWTLSEDLLARADYAGDLSAVNPAWTRVLGWSERELLTSPYADLIHPADIETTVAALAAMRRTGQPTRFENQVLTRDGVWKPLDWTVAPEADGINFIAVGRDLSADKARAAELAEAQEALRQAQKMEAVGQLTGGLAHDFNNILAGISGSLQLIEARIAAGRVAEVNRYVNGALGAARRAAGLTQRLLAFSRRQTLDPQPTDLNRLIAGMEELIGRSVGPQIAVETVPRDGLWTTFVDPGQLENALLNLCLNARDAMPEGGRLRIATGNLRLDEPAARERGLPPGHYVSLAVSDSGTGMPPEIVARAFDPFYTTKPIGQGTGLGLSMVYGFAGQSGGVAQIDSELDKGTTVSILVPRHVGSAPVAGLSDATSAIEASVRHETILVVDDEPLVRMVVVEQLNELGYAVLEAEDAPSALKVLETAPTLDLLVTDVGLPGGMNGRQLADAVRQQRPHLQVLFITGYAENAVLNFGHLDPGMHVMTKPFAVEDFAKRVGRLLT